MSVLKEHLSYDRMSCVFPYVGNFQYAEPDNFDEALNHIKSVESDLQVIQNYLRTRKQLLEEGKKLGFASVDDYVTYRSCETKMKAIAERRTM